MTEGFPWQRRDALAAWLAAWQQRWAGRAVARVTAGPGWLGLSLSDEPRHHLFVLALPGLTLFWDAPTPPPPPA